MITVTLKEGGRIRIVQKNEARLCNSYTIALFVPTEEMCIESWSFSKYKYEIGLLPPKTAKDPLYDEVSSTYNNLYDEYRKRKINEYSKYFPQ